MNVGQYEKCTYAPPVTQYYKWRRMWRPITTVSTPLLRSLSFIFKLWSKHYGHRTVWILHLQLIQLLWKHASWMIFTLKPPRINTKKETGYRVGIAPWCTLCSFMSWGDVTSSSKEVKSLALAWHCWFTLGWTYQLVSQLVSQLVETSVKLEIFIISLEWLSFWAWLCITNTAKLL